MTNLIANISQAGFIADINEEQQKAHGKLTPVPKPPEVLTPDNFDAFFPQFEITEAQNIPDPLPCVQVTGERFMTYGNISVITAKAKNGKTALSSLITAERVKSTFEFYVPGNILQAIPDEKKVTIYIDTEQQRNDGARILKRIAAIVGHPVGDKLRYFSLATIDPAQRMLFLELATKHIKNIGLIILDGVRDVMFDINDTKEAVMCVTNVRRITENAGAHTLCIIHQNKGDDNARGHLGTELINKCELAISLEKKGDEFIVSAKETRYKAFAPFAFMFGNEGLPFILGDWNQGKDKENAKLSPYDIERITHNEMLREIFKTNSELKRSDLEGLIKLVFDKNGSKLHNTQVCQFITYYEQEEFLSKRGNGGRGGIYYSLKKPV